MPNENKYEKRLTDTIDYEKLQLGSETYVHTIQDFHAL